MNAAKVITDSILNQLKTGRPVLFFVTGGSAISVGVKVAEILKKSSDKNLIKNLTITLTDERYGPVGHLDSNWQQLLDKGFNLSPAKLFPVLTGDNFEITTEKFNVLLKKELAKNSYKIGLFGIGADGHTAGILPESIAVNSINWACIYKTEKFERITITSKTIEKLDEAVVFAQGKEKWNTLENLKKNIPINKQPAQILKKIPKLTIFSDCPSWTFNK